VYFESICCKFVNNRKSLQSSRTKNKKYFLNCEFNESPCGNLDIDLNQRANFFVTNYEFEGSFGMSLWWDCVKVEVTKNLEFLDTFGMSLEGVCHEL
jgi:hypothetical protein